MFQLPKTTELLSRLPSELTSLGDDAEFLKRLKQHCALPDDVSWTERDELLKAYLDAAEMFIDDMTGTIFRPREFELSLENVFDATHTKYRLPIRPIADLSFAWTDSSGDTGIFTADTDYALKGLLSRSPEIHILSDSAFYELDFTKVPYPFTLTITTAADASNGLQSLAICQLASYYYRTPEAMGSKLPDMDQSFFALLSSISGSIL